MMPARLGVALWLFFLIVSSTKAKKDEIVMVFENPNSEAVELVWLDSETIVGTVGIVTGNGLLEAASYLGHELGWRLADKAVQANGWWGKISEESRIPSSQRIIVHEQRSRIILWLDNRPRPRLLFDDEVAAVDEAMRSGEKRHSVTSNQIQLSAQQRRYYYYLRVPDVERFENSLTRKGQFSLAQVFWPRRFAERSTTFGTNRRSVDALAFEWNSETFAVVSRDSDNCHRVEEEENNLLCSGTIVITHEKGSPLAQIELHMNASVPSPLMLSSWREDAQYIDTSVRSHSLPRMPRILTLGCGPQSLVLGLELAVRARLFCYDTNRLARATARRNAKRLGLSLQTISTPFRAFRRPHLIMLDLPMYDDDSDTTYQDFSPLTSADLGLNRRPPSDALHTLDKLLTFSTHDPAEILNNTQQILSAEKKGSLLLIHGSSARLAQLQLDYQHSLCCDSLRPSSTVVPVLACRSASDSLDHHKEFSLTSFLLPFHQQQRSHHRHPRHQRDSDSTLL